jgi:hypothetical protein
MAHYAQLDSDNVVTFVFVGRDDVVEGIDDWETYYAPEGYIVKQTSYNTRGGVHYDPETGEPSEDQTKALRGTYAGIGFHYDEDLDIFYPPQPYASWTLNAQTASWEPPVAYPEDGESYTWDEETQEWTAVENETE